MILLCNYISNNAEYNIGDGSNAIVSAKRVNVIHHA